jgi:hypothetical protein
LKRSDSLKGEIENMTEAEKRIIRRQQRKELDAKYFGDKYEKTSDRGEERAAAAKIVKEEKAAAAIKPRSQMINKEKSDYIAKHGREAYLNLPW